MVVDALVALVIVAAPPETLTHEYPVIEPLLATAVAETVASILGQADAAVWDQYRDAFVNQGIKFTATVAGGSTLKPTSATKKQQAVQLSQALGQFASAAPVAILVALKVMERAFDEVLS